MWTRNLFLAVLAPLLVGSSVASAPLARADLLMRQSETTTPSPSEPQPASVDRNSTEKEQPRGTEAAAAEADNQAIEIQRQVAQDNTPSDAPDKVQITFQVEAPASTPADNATYITGNDPNLRSWNPQGVRLQRLESGEYEVAVQLTKGSHIEYKITRGSWATVEKGDKGQEIPNRTLEVDSERVVSIRVARWRDQQQLERLQQRMEEHRQRAERAAAILKLFADSPDPTVHTYVESLLSSLEVRMVTEETGRLRTLVREKKIDDAVQLYDRCLHRLLDAIVDSPNQTSRVADYVGRMQQALQLSGESDVAEKLFAKTATIIEQQAQVTGNDALKGILTDLHCQQLAARIRTGHNVEADEMSRLLAELRRRWGEQQGTDLTAQTLSIPLQLGRALEYSDQLDLAIEVYRTLRDAIGETSDSRLNHTAELLEGILRRLSLPGNPIELSGTTLHGEPFDWDSYRGKIVLIDFWATWCGPCRAEIPNVVHQYNLYRDRGFDVVGINLDRDRKKLETFLDSEKLPWVTLHEQSDDGQNLMATRYGISTIPTVLLVDRDGKVVSLRARGAKLAELLEQLIGPPFDPQGKLTFIDLQPQSNQELAENMHFDEPGDNFLAELSPGEHTLAGIRFQIGKGLIHLGSTVVPHLPEGVLGIPVNQTLQRLYLMHGMASAKQFGFKDGATVGAYIVHYEDETSETIPIIYGEDVRDWWNVDNSRPVSRAAVAWEGSNPQARQSGASLRLYARCWANPHPEKVVTDIDFISEKDCAAAPFCVAMTLEGDADDQRQMAVNAISQSEKHDHKSAEQSN